MTKKLLLLCWIFLLLRPLPIAHASRLQDSLLLPEGNDFATLVLRDAWDMSEYSDVSQYINRSGQADMLRNIAVNGGIFSAQVTSLKQSSFHVLFPGYKNGLLVGKVGHQYPIDANTYKCLYVAAKVDSGAGSVPDQMVVFWFANENLNGAGGVWGQLLPGIVLYPEYGIQPANPPVWKLYRVKLDDPNVGQYGTRWSDAPNGQWQGLRIDPTLQETTFAVDWVRLTDCAPVQLPISWSGSSNVSIFVRPFGTTRDIEFARNVQGNSYVLDVEGLPPGSYTYRVKNGNNLVASGDFAVNQTPIVDFVSPSFTSGVDYSSGLGNPWDMSDSLDVVSSRCTSSNFSDGLLILDTPSVGQQPATCRPGGYTDAGIYLNTPQPADPNQYRYLSFQMYTAGPWQNVPQGMISRLLWQTQGTSGLPANRCIMVTYAVPLDVGWHTYHIDLWDPVDGAAEAHAGECPSGPLSWRNSTPVLEFRFDPNENISGQTFHQELDWIRLTKMNQVTRGTPYPVRFTLNKPTEQVNSVQVFYTTDPTSPYQFAATLYSPQAVGMQTFIPLVGNGNPTGPSDGQAYMLDTSSIPAGFYYICITADDGVNSATYCSEAELWVR